jgi:hypothetical protein
MTQKRRRIVISLGLLVIAAGLFYVWLPAAWHYRLFQDGVSLTRALSKVEPGTSVGELEGRLGAVQREADASNRDLIAVYKRMEEGNPDGFPDGVIDRDEFILLPVPADDTAMRLQVRDGRLVNFNPRNFDAPYERPRILNAVD